MPQLKKAEFWDSVTPPVLPGGWEGSPGFQTSTALALSPPNSLRYLTPGQAAYLYWAGTMDTFNGNARVRAAFQFTGLAAQQQVELFLRFNPVSGNAYLVNVEPAGSANDGVTLFKSVNGVATQLGSTLGVGQLALNTWYQVQVQTFGNNILASVQRLSDGFWLNGFLGWVPYPVACVQAQDNAIPGAGYAGLSAYQDATETNPLYSDNFVFEDLSPDPGILLKKRRRPALPVPVKKKRKRGWQWFSPVLTPPPLDNYIWYQNNTNAPCGFRNTGCAGIPDTNGQTCLVRLGVRGGPVVSMYHGTGIYHTSEPAAQAPWPPGPWVVRLNVVDAASGDWIWDSVTICRVSTACNSINQIAAAGGLGITLSSTGVYQVTLQGIGDANAHATDSFYIIYGFLLGLQTAPGLKVMLDQEIDTPFNYISGLGQFVPDRTGLVKSSGLRLTHRPTSAGLRWRKYRIPATLLTPQPPQTGPFAPALFRKRRRVFTETQRRGNNPYPRSGSFVRKIDTVISTTLSPRPPWPPALFPKPRHRRPSMPAKKYRRLARWLSLTPFFVGPDKAMIANALVEENFQAAVLTTETLPGTGRVIEAMSGSVSLILGDVLRKQPLTAR